MSSVVVAALMALLIPYSVALVEAKPLNQNQVKFRRLPPKEFSAAIGSSITIECEAGGSPPPSIHWLKNGIRILQNDLEENQLDGGGGQPVQVDEINRIGLSSTRSRLFIDCADYQDEAVYSCVAENAFTRISSHTKLNLIKPLPAATVAASSATGNENDLLAGPLEEAMELAASATAAASTANNKPLNGDSNNGGDGGLENNKQKQNGLSAVPQCLSHRGTKVVEPLRIHMWTHNIVEVMRNSVVLYCRTNAIKKQSNNQQDMTSTDLNNNNNNNRKPEDKSSISSRTASVSWTLPDDKIVGDDQKEKYEVLETGDLLIKDLAWSDMGSYVCSVSDEQSSDSVSSFVYPASVKSNSKRST